MGIHITPRALQRMQKVVGAAGCDKPVVVITMRATNGAATAKWGASVWEQEDWREAEDAGLAQVQHTDGLEIHFVPSDVKPKFDGETLDYKSGEFSLE